MNQIDEDATLSQLANALVTSFGAAGKVKDALYIYSEMADKYGRTTDLEMHQAVVSVLTQDYAAAEELLEVRNFEEARDVLKRVGCEMIY